MPKLKSYFRQDDSRHLLVRLEDEPLHNRFGPVSDRQRCPDVEAFRKLGPVWNVCRELEAMHMDRFLAVFDDCDTFCVLSFIIEMWCLLIPMW